MMQIKTVYADGGTPDKIDGKVNNALAELGDTAFAIQYFHWWKPMKDKPGSNELHVIAHIQWDDKIK